MTTTHDRIADFTMTANVQNTINTYRYNMSNNNCLRIRSNNNNNIRRPLPPPQNPAFLERKSAYDCAETAEMLTTACNTTGITISPRHFCFFRPGGDGARRGGEGVVFPSVGRIRRDYATYVASGGGK